MFNDVCSVRTWAGNWTINEQNLSACWLKMNPKCFQIIFFKIAVVITVINIYNRFFTKRVTNPGCHRIKVFRSKSTIPFYPSVTSWCGNSYLDDGELRDKEALRVGVPDVFFTWLPAWLRHFLFGNLWDWRRVLAVFWRMVKLSLAVGRKLLNWR